MPNSKPDLAADFREPDAQLEKGGTDTQEIYEEHLENLRLALNELASCVKTTPDRSTVIFNIDEGHELDRSGAVSIACLVAVFADLGERTNRAHLAVLTSTALDVSPPAPGGVSRLPTAGARWFDIRKDKPIQPWSFFGVNLDVEQRNEIPTAAEARTFDYQVRIGRPL